MEFLATVSLEANSAELEVWNCLKEALRAEDGFAFLRYPIFVQNGSRRYEPDILLLHRQLGFVVIEVKGCRAGNVAALEGHQWRMADWYEPYCAPYDQAQRQMWALRNHFWRYPELANHLHGSALVALPFVSEAQWADRGFRALPCNPGIIHQDQLTPARLRKRLRELSAMGDRPPLTDAEWMAACQVLGLSTLLERHDDVRLGAAPPEPDLAPNELLARIRASEARIAALDPEQQRIGFEIPPGPQRIRGIAGSGKTLLLAVKAARMHLSHPEWDIAFTFNTKSLYQVAIAHIQRFCQEFGGCDPDWSKLRVMHGWGNREQTGLYRHMAEEAGYTPRSVDWLNAQLGFASPSERLALLCRDLLVNAKVPPRFDAILIDEGQDFLPEFYQLAYAALKAPKRLVWAYDEAQSLEHLKIPTAEALFGRDESGALKVDLTGLYPGGIHKSRIMRKCYRTPAKILVPAHTFGMGLLRPRGAVQLITTRAAWQDIGYEVQEGGFDSPGQEVVIARPLMHCPHPLDHGFAEPLLRPRPFQSREDELDDCAARLSDLARRGVIPDDMLVVFLGTSRQNKAIEKDMGDMAARLQQRGLAAHIADNRNASVFREPGKVTLSGIHRAKGHEAAYVFVVGLDRLADVEADTASRNQLFVGLTRSRGLCRLSGLVPQAKALFEELDRVLEQGLRVRFRTPDPKQLSREISEKVALQPFVRHLPFYSDMKAAAGAFDNAREHDPDALEWIDASELGALHPDMFVIPIVGSSMEPRIQSGALAVFQRTRGDWPEGKIVLAALGDEMTEVGASLVVKRLDLQSSAAGLSYRLTSVNPEYPSISVRPESPVRVEAVFKRVLSKSGS